jgi:hypothetical protein
MESSCGWYWRKPPQQLSTAKERRKTRKGRLVVVWVIGC